MWSARACRAPCRLDVALRHDLRLSADLLQERHELIEEVVVGKRARRVVVRVGGVTIDQGEIAQRYLRLRGQDACRRGHLGPAECGASFGFLLGTQGWVLSGVQKHRVRLAYCVP